MSCWWLSISCHWQVTDMALSDHAFQCASNYLCIIQPIFECKTLVDVTLMNYFDFKNVNLCLIWSALKQSAKHLFNGAVQCFCLKSNFKPIIKNINHLLVLILHSWQSSFKLSLSLFEPLCFSDLCNLKHNTIKTNPSQTLSDLLL